MSNLRLYRNLGFGILTALLIFMIVVAIVTYTSRDSASPLLEMAAHNHIIIMFIMVIIAVLFGFVWSSISLRELDMQKKESKNMLDVVLLFLNKDERSIINHLVQNAGETTQAEISRLEGMGRVKAFTSLQKMQERRIIQVIAHGKIRKVKLSDPFRDILIK